MKAPVLKTLLGALLIGLLCIGAEAVSISTGIVPVLDSSRASIDVSGSYYPLGVYTSDSRTDSAASGTVAASIFFPVETMGGAAATAEFTHAQASVNSSFGQNQNQIMASGAVNIWAAPSREETYFLLPRSRAQAVSVFDLSFTVATPMAYELSGWLEMQTGDYGSLLLQSLSGPPLIEIGKSSFDAVGVLDPGVYELRAIVSAVSIGDRHDSDWGYAAFDLTMDFASIAVPDSGHSAALLCIGFAGIALMRCVDRCRGPALFGLL